MNNTTIGVMNKLKELFEKIISLSLKKGCNYVEVYYEETKTTKYNLMDSKLDDIVNLLKKGIGIRIIKDEKIYYTSTNDVSEKNVLAATKKLLKNIKCENNTKNVTFTLNKLEEQYADIKIPHDKFPITKKISILKQMDKKARKVSKTISGVHNCLIENEKKYIISNSNGIFKSSNEVTTRLMCIPYATKNGKTETTFKAYGKGQGYEFLEDFDYLNYAQEVAKTAVKKLSAEKFQGGKVPAILGHGFGAVIFHEACGHSLEATSTADNLSVFSNKIGQKIATSKVTLIDDGTIPYEWGTTLIDSEGHNTQKNILIKKGILNSYLVDYANTKKLNHPLTGSGRRESYQYPPTSRMNNTYLEKGTDKITDMIKSIDYGIYCKSLDGGSVDVNTGDFNFSADECYLIKNGEIKNMITGVTLIGKGQDILKKVEMVSDDLVLETGYCGSQSGTVLVTVGEPTIKISEILVGGQS